jgi:hypothetical protein
LSLLTRVRYGVFRCCTLRCSNSNRCRKRSISKKFNGFGYLGAGLLRKNTKKSSQTVYSHLRSVASYLSHIVKRGNWKGT